MVSNLITSWAGSHWQYLAGIAIGFVLANPIWCAGVLFRAFVRIPAVGPWIAANPDKAKAWFDTFDHAIDACVDKYAASSQPQNPSQTAQPK